MCTVVRCRFVWTYRRCCACAAAVSVISLIQHCSKCSSGLQLKFLSCFRYSDPPEPRPEWQSGGSAKVWLRAACLASACYRYVAAYWCTYSYTLQFYTYVRAFAGRGVCGLMIKPLLLWKKSRSPPKYGGGLLNPKLWNGLIYPLNFSKSSTLPRGSFGRRFTTVTMVCYSDQIFKKS
jgi:hypothetical protein